MHANIYVYKCVVDDGTAPCVDRGLLSMTICKSKVRTSAKVGDIVIAFGTNAKPAPNRLVYAAKITAVVPDAAYFDTPKFQKRQDCIYKRTPQGTLKLVPTASAHNTGNHAKDLGPPPNYPNAIALISTDFRYFGGAGTDVARARPALEEDGRKPRPRSSPQPHPRSPRRPPQTDERVWKKFSKKVNGKPRHVDK
jgi:hypothetical protein